jgi:hypothetical protein
MAIKEKLGAVVRELEQAAKLDSENPKPTSVWSGLSVHAFSVKCPISETHVFSETHVYCALE